MAHVCFVSTSHSDHVYDGRNKRGHIFFGLTLKINLEKCLVYAMSASVLVCMQRKKS